MRRASSYVRGARGTAVAERKGKPNRGNVTSPTPALAFSLARARRDDTPSNLLAIVRRKRKSKSLKVKAFANEPAPPPASSGCLRPCVPSSSSRGRKDAISKKADNPFPSPRLAARRRHAPRGVNPRVDRPGLFRRFFSIPPVTYLSSSLLPVAVDFPPPPPPPPPSPPPPPPPPPRRIRPMA